MCILIIKAYAPLQKVIILPYYTYIYRYLDGVFRSIIRLPDTQIDESWINRDE